MIYSISDLHLDYTENKSMNIFGDNWKDHNKKIFNNWQNIINNNDYVLIAGDISWQIRMEEAYIDLIQIDKLPGKKIMIKGNHDFWWDSISKLRNLKLKTISFIQNDSIDINDFSICGTRAWLDKEDSDFKKNDLKIFERELIRLKLSLESCKRNKIICMFHYPPFNKDGNTNEFADLMSKYKVDTCIYGHLHSDGLKMVVEGSIGGVNYICTSCDYIDFKPILIKEIL